ncbi:MAG: acyl carrier protein [Clostridia bacterium]|nr:acyl carrier protein [Clostridia bacterium]
MAKSYTHAEIIEKLNEIFSFVLDDEVSLTPETTAADVDGWDSLSHITLIGEIEDAFGFRFLMKEVVGMKNVGEMIDIISARATK